MGIVTQKINAISKKTSNKVPSRSNFLALEKLYVKTIKVHLLLRSEFNRKYIIIIKTNFKIISFFIKQGTS